MALFRCGQSIAKFPVLIFTTLSMASMPAFPQTAPPPSQPASSSRPATHNSVEVVEHLSPEEVEEGNLNHVYQSVAELQRKGACTAEIIQRYESEVLPPAEKSTFNVPRNKFLFLANRDIGNCYLAQQKFTEAEASFQKILQYAPVWPGTNDSAYPINFRQIATAQMGQQHWTAAEQSLVKSIALFDPQIATWEQRNAELTLNYRGSQSESYALLAVVYFREGLVQDALDTVEKAYGQIIKYNVATRYREEVENIGKSIANASGNADAQKVWSERSSVK